MLNIVFDCDGTLVDSEPLHNRADATVFARHGLPIDLEEHRVRFTGVGRAAVLRVVQEERGVQLPANIHKQIDAELERLISLELQPIPQVIELLQRLAERGACMAVASNSHLSYIRLALQTCGIDGFFGDRIASADLVARLKPAPDVYLLAAEMLNTPPKECFAVEDSHVGAFAASAAGMRVIGFAPADHVHTPQQLRDAGALHVITEFAQLLEIVCEA